MPCYTIRTISVELKGADTDVLLRGLKAAGFRVSHDVASETITAYSKTGVPLTIKGGRISTVEGQERWANEINKAYAAEAVRTVARKFSFNLKQDARNAQHLTLTKRSF